MKIFSLPFSNIIFGGGIIALPGRNFARYLLAIFILFCLVLRTAYQGKQFEFLQKDMRPADIETIEDMIENNFTFLIVSGQMQLYQEMDFMKRFVDPKNFAQNCFRWIFFSEFVWENLI